MSTQKFIVAVAGMQGSGKSLVGDVARQDGYDVVIMGDEVRAEARKRSLAPTPENIGKIMLELRSLEGEAAIARRCIPKVEKTLKSKVLVDGIRSLSEVEEFKKRFGKVALVAVHSSPETRFQRVYNRRRSDDPANWLIFRERDLRELSVGLGNSIAMSEHIIVNEETLKTAKDKARQILKEIERKWTKSQST
jgi:dephospho-CoA kinase